MGRVVALPNKGELKAELKHELKVELEAGLNRIRAELEAELDSIRAALRSGTQNGGGNAPSDDGYRDVSVDSFEEGRPPTVSALRIETSEDYGYRATNLEALYTDKERAAGEATCVELVSPDASLWDTALIIGSAPVGNAASAFMALMLAANPIIQIGIVIILQVSGLTSPTIGPSQIADLQRWRRSVGHDLKYYNARTQQSLVARVCDLDFGLEMSANQLRMVGDLRSYIGDREGADFASAMGPGE